jgi:AraC family transcriptional regulator of arabinose operon
VPPRTETAQSLQVGLFADEFRKDASYTNWRPHGTRDWLLIYTEAGGGRIVTPSGAFVTAQGDALLYAPSQMHDYSTAADHWHLLWAHFVPTPAWQRRLVWPTTKGLRMLHLRGGEVRDQFRAAMLRAIHMVRRKLPGALDLATNAIEEALLWANVAASKDPWLSMDPRVRKAVDYLGANLREPFQLAALARHCGSSVSRFAYLFKRETGFSPRHYLEQQRLRHACQLLRLTSLGIAEIAAETGFADPFYFSNRFRRFEKLSPTAFRLRHQRDGRRHHRAPACT